MRRTASALAALTIVALAPDLSAQDTEWNRYTLEELPGVYVSAEIDQACESEGISSTSVVTGAEAALASAEVDALSHDAMLETPGHPELKITLSCAAGDGSASGAVGYALSLRLQQAAQMIRDPQISLPEAVTWFADTVGVAATSDVASSVDKALQAKVEAFAAAFVAANTAAAEEPN